MQKDAWIEGDLEPGTRCADERERQGTRQACTEWRASPLLGDFESAASG
jgi:hypothetical protein